MRQTVMLGGMAMVLAGTVAAAQFRAPSPDGPRVDRDRRALRGQSDSLLCGRQVDRDQPWPSHKARP